jgi:hypothetical protein
VENASRTPVLTDDETTCIRALSLRPTVLERASLRILDRPDTRTYLLPTSSTTERASGAPG